MIEQITRGERIIAIIVSQSFKEDGAHFFTPNDFSQQLAYMKHPTGRCIDSHVHNPITRQVTYTQEVLMIRKGRLRVDLYDANREYFSSRILEAGDVILLASGGHGFEVLEEVEMIEVKQGPYAGDCDKTRFEPVAPGQIVIEKKR